MPGHRAFFDLPPQRPTPGALFHYTDDARLEAIRRDGMIKPSPTPLGAVVWLTTISDAIPERARWWKDIDEDGQPVGGPIPYLGLPPQRLAVSIGLTVPPAEVSRWSTWAERAGASPQDMAVVKRDAHSKWKTWRVVTRPIPAAEWHHIDVAGLRLT